MPKRRYERREPSHEWQKIQPLLNDPAQIQYEILRPVVLWGQTPKERGAETGVSPRTIYYRANLFDQAGMASLLPAAPPPAIPRQDKRTFEKAHTWEDLLAAHDKWMTDYNFQKHMAHEERQDGCHSPAAVLGWVKGMQPEPELVHQVFEAICETRRLNKAGYTKFRNFLLYGERGLAGEEAVVNIFQDLLTLEYQPCQVK